MTETPVFLPYNDIFEQDVIRIANEGFGEGYMGTRKIRSLAADSGPFYVASISGEVAGYCCFQYVSAIECAKSLKLPESLLLEHAGGCGNVCLTRTMAVADSHRKSGIAYELFSLCLEDARAAGLASAWGGAWKIGEEIPMRRIFLANGFSCYGEVPMIWYDESDYICSYCNGPCRCTGVIYYKTLGRAEQ
ncbi:MAG: GNAT family N-acetyltransferase [Oscillospiraceae bacterium]|nr:GNAT family N-acetyltransferase [Oscillospiraceae bacterium]